MLAGVGFAAGIRRQDSRRELLIIAGLLIGLAFVVSPIVHNFYHLLMLPLVAALLDQGLAQKPGRKADWKLLLPVIVFVLVDFIAVMPLAGPLLRDLGVPLLSLIYLMWTGAMVLTKWRENQNQAAV
jgi:H+/gluconate symporter-like permease